MAIVQISRIQHRRGRKLTSTGMPQLASGEIGWAIDTREMYIGNGSVSEGSPSVGNTKVLTEHDNIFDLAEQYSYKPTDSLWGVTIPTARSLQDRLDDFVSIANFGASGNGTDQTTEIQNALNSLYLNGESSNRVILYFPAGEYVISEVLSVPPYATIRGAGKDKTIFTSSLSNVFKTVNSTSDVETTIPYNDSVPNQARYIDMSDFTINITGSNTALDVVDCVHSTFKNIKFVGGFAPGGADDQLIAIRLASRVDSAGTVETKWNKFENLEIDGFHYAVYSNYDIRENTWKDCYIYMAKFGISFGENTTLGDVGMLTGPLFNTFENCTFDLIDEEAIMIINGEYNTSKGNKFFGVGYNPALEREFTRTPCIKFASITNVSESDYFERTQALSPNLASDETYNEVYVPEIEGRTLYNNKYANQIAIGERLFSTEILKLPVVNTGSIFIDYIYTDDFNDIVREGVLTLTVDNRAGSEDVTINDEYNLLVRPPLSPAVISAGMKFTANLANFGGNSTFDTVSIEVVNTNATNNDKFTYTIRVKS